MKKLILFALTICSLGAGAQTKEGRVVYERTIQMQMRAFNNPEISNQIPRSRTDQFELLFSNNRTLWQYLPSAIQDETTTITSGNTTVQVRTANISEVIFMDLENKRRVDQREVMERNFVVTDTMEKLNWKLSDESKTILNRTARKAIAQRISTRPIVTMENGEMKRTEVADTSKIIAWYTTEIPISAGPAFYQGQLPGLILELDINNGRQVFKAIEISSKDNIAAKIKEPKEGKKVTSAEFQKERDKLMEEMRKNMPQGNVIRMQ